MKIGPYCGYSLEEIIDIKRSEEEKVGVFYFGYSGVFCHPSKVNRFLVHAKRNGITEVKILFITTPSSFTSNLPRSSTFSIDGFNWAKLNESVLLVGNKFAFVAKNIKNVNYHLDITQYRVMLGMRRGNFLNDYLKYRADKGCAIYEPQEHESKFVRIEYECDLVYPFCVFVR